MQVNINYYGHGVDIDPEAVADRLPENPSDEDISRALQAEIEDALKEDPAEFHHDGEDVLERVKELLKEREDAPGE